MNIKKIEDERFEFLLTINGKNIVCQRYVKIRDFNEDCIGSSEVDELLDTIVGMNNGGVGFLGIIPKYLKQQSVNYLWENYNPYYEQQEVVWKNIFEKEDIFEFEIRVDKNCIGKKSFSGNYFPQKVRYQVNIKEIIPEIMAQMRYFLSLKNYSKVLA